MAKTGFYQSSWHDTSLKDFFRFTLFFLPDRYFQDKKVIKPNQQGGLVESEVELGDEVMPLTGTNKDQNNANYQLRKKTSLLKT